MRKRNFGTVGIPVTLPVTIRHAEGRCEVRPIAVAQDLPVDNAPEHQGVGVCSIEGTESVVERHRIRPGVNMRRAPDSDNDDVG